MSNTVLRKFQILASSFLLAVAAGGIAMGVPLSEPTTSPLVNKHNFSKNSKATIKSSDETQICIFCHTPHGASAQSTLWNRPDPDPGVHPVTGTTAYDLNASGTLIIKTPAGNDSKYTNTDTDVYPNGATRLCMSCHDGLTAVGTILNGVINNGDGDAILTAKASVVNLSTSHPVSFVYKSPGDTVLLAINAPAAKNNTFQYPVLPTVPLDGLGRMQCTTCHDPHEDTQGTDPAQPPFWRHVVAGDPTASYDMVCATCHIGSSYIGIGPSHP